MVITFSKLSKLYPPTISMFKTYYVCLRLFKLFSVNDKAKRKWDIFPDECCFWILLAESVYYALKICLYHFLKVTRDLQLPGSVTSNYQAQWFPDSSCILTSLFHLTLLLSGCSFDPCLLCHTYDPSSSPTHLMAPRIPLRLSVFVSLEPWHAAPWKRLLAWGMVKSLNWLRGELWRQEDGC